MKHLLITTISAVVLLGCGKAQKPTLSSEAKSDEFDLVIRKDLEDLFAKTKAGKNFVEEKLSRDSYNAKQKGKLAKLLKEERKGLGVAFFHTNGKNYGKLLYTWGVGPKLHLREVVVFRAKENLFLESIVIGSGEHIDLDTGKGTHKPGVFDSNYKPDLHFSNVNGQLMFLSETDGARFLFPMKSIRPEDDAALRVEVNHFLKPVNNDGASTTESKPLEEDGDGFDDYDIKGLDRNWVLESIYKDGEKITPAKNKVHSINFSTKGRVTGKNDCNQYFGQFELKKGNNIKFHNGFESTMMACFPKSLGKKFISALSKSKSFEIGEKLKLYFADQPKNLLTFVIADVE